MFPADILKPIYDIIDQVCKFLLSPFGNGFWYGIFPYIALFIGFYGLFHRYRKHQFSYTTHSSQFLNRSYTIPQALNYFHYGLGIILTVHFLLVVFELLAPKAINTFFADNPLVLLTFEASLWALTMGVIISISSFVARRIKNANVRRVTTKSDWLLLFFIAVQVILGFIVATSTYPGSNWFSGTLVPWFVSIAVFSPDVELMSSFNGILGFHALTGFVLFALIPYTRLVHFLSLPYGYFFRKYQISIWYAKRKVGAKTT